MDQARDKLTLARTFHYSMASAGINMMGVTMHTWLLYFDARPPGAGHLQYLPAAPAGAILLPISLCDAAIDPSIGPWSEAPRSRWGRQRPFILLGAPAMALFLVLMWMPPAGAPPPAGTPFPALMVLGSRATLSLAGILYDPTLPEMAPRAIGRLAVSCWRNVLCIVGVLIATMAARLLFQSARPAAMGAVAGVCGEFANLTTALARAAGIAVRSVSGLMMPLSLPCVTGTATRRHPARSHAWTEMYTGEGWEIADPSWALRMP